MPRDDDPSAEPDAPVDFVVGSDPPSGTPARPPSGPLGGRSARSMPGHDDPAEDGPAEDRPVPDWLRRRGTLAGGAVVLIAAALIARAVSTHHHAATAPRTAGSESGAAVVATGSPALQYPAPAAAISGCTYKLQSATVDTLPDAATAALMSALPGVQVTASSTQLGHSATSGPCVLQRVVAASLAGVSVQVDVRAKSAGDASSAVRTVGATAETVHVTVVVGARAVDVTAVQPLGVAGRPAIATRSLQQLAADPRLIAA